MKSYAFLLFIIAETLIISGCDDNKSLFDVTDLMCENLTDPPGIATADPALSWKIISGKNGTSQKAFQVVAATDIKLLNEEKADLWNSGKMLSSENILVPYTGKKLTSSSFCYWKVRVWDQNDDMSEWSEAASFGVGPLQPSDWDGDYIGFTDNSGKTISPQLRQSFGINDNSGKFLLHVNSLGYHEVWFNGEKIGKNVLTPAVSQFNKRSLTVTYDISEHIRKGENDLVLWIGQEIGRAHV